MTDNQAPSLPPAEALQQLVAKWRHLESVDETGLPHGVIWASDCADDLEKLLGEAVLETIAPPQTWQPLSESDISSVISALQQDDDIDATAYARIVRSLRPVASPRGGPAKE